MKTAMFIFLLALAAGAPAFGQDDYPSKPIRLITPAAQIGRASCRERV